MPICPTGKKLVRFSFQTGAPNWLWRQKCSARKSQFRQSIQADLGRPDDRAKIYRFRFFRNR
jgi:hypothetical protein